MCLLPYIFMWDAFYGKLEKCSFLPAGLTVFDYYFVKNKLFIVWLQWKQWLFLGGWHVSRPLDWRDKNYLCDHQRYRDRSRAGTKNIIELAEEVYSSVSQDIRVTSVLCNISRHCMWFGRYLNFYLSFLLNFSTF